LDKEDGSYDKALSINYSPALAKIYSLLNEAYKKKVQQEKEESKRRK